MAGKNQSLPIIISAFVLGAAIIFAYFNSLFDTSTLLMMLYGFVAMLGGLAHKFTGDWGIVNLAIAIFGVILLAIWLSIDTLLMMAWITIPEAETLRMFWQGFTFIIILGLIYIVGELQIFN